MGNKYTFFKYFFNILNGTNCPKNKNKNVPRFTIFKGKWSDGQMVYYVLFSVRPLFGNTLFDVGLWEIVKLCTVYNKPRIKMRCYVGGDIQKGRPNQRRRGWS